ncbi:MAG: hypothetical protein M1836_007795 [Candelina mexicana]|nr:MAG: hypothetical protein M1836_007795 [Candelina mexicana]
MDYSYFTAPPQPFHFLGLPPTPSHTHTSIPENFTNGTPPESYDQGFRGFDSFPGFDPNALISQTPPQDQRPSSLVSLHGDSGMGMDMDPDQRARSSSEEKDNLTPAQSRRKAQNRAAQRAFRERKERHVKDLEQKLTALEQATTTLKVANDRLKRELQKVATENEILRATSSSTSGPAAKPSPSEVVGPMNYSPIDIYYSNVLDGHDNKSRSHRITVSEKTGEKMLAAGATWDLIQQHELFLKGLVDVGDVCERLKKIAKCDGQGPVFEERDVLDAIEASAASGSDELI